MGKVFNGSVESKNYDWSKFDPVEPSHFLITHIMDNSKSMLHDK